MQLIFIDLIPCNISLRSDFFCFVFNSSCDVLHRVMPSKDRDVFSSFFPILFKLFWFQLLEYVLFIFSCPIALSRTPRTMLNSDENGHLFFVPSLTEKAFILSSLSLMLAVGFFINALCEFEEVPSIPSFLRGFFFSWNEIKFYEMRFFCISWCAVIIFFFFGLLM